MKIQTKILIGILTILVLIGFLIWRKYRIFGNVLIETQKTEYQIGEALKLVIKNNFNRNICFSSCYPYYLEKKNGEWKSYPYEECPEANVNETCIEANKEKFFEIDLTLVKLGLHRIAVPICIDCKKGFDFKESKRFYSNEFWIREKEIEVEKEFLYVLTQNFGSFFYEVSPTEKFDWPYIEILKIDLESSEIVKKEKIDGFGIEVKKGENIYLLSYRFPAEIRNLKDVESIVKAIQEIKSLEELERLIIIYDQELNQIASHPSDIFDFEVNENYLYGLKKNILEIIDFENPENPQKLSSLSFKKPPHDIIFKDNKLYLLDNIMMPLYLHIVDVENPKEPKLFTYETFGVNAYLKTQDVTNKWFVIESYSHRGGFGINLRVFNITPPIQQLANLELYKYLWYEGGERERISIIKIKNIDNYLYALNQPNSQIIELLVYDLKDFKKTEKVSTLLLEEDKKISFLKELGFEPTLIKDENLLYYGADDGIYLIDISDPSKPFKKDIIKTDFQVIFLELSKKEEIIIEETADWKTYRNEYYGFEIDYPIVGWEFQVSSLEKQEFGLFRLCKEVSEKEGLHSNLRCLFGEILFLDPKCSDFNWEEAIKETHLVKYMTVFFRQP